jgi:hypothetical protein
VSCEILSSLGIRQLLHFNLLLWNLWAKWYQTWQECSLDGPVRSWCFWVFFLVDQKYTKETRGTKVSNWVLSVFDLLLKHWANWNKTWWECLLDGPIKSLGIFYWSTFMKKTRDPKVSKRVLSVVFEAVFFQFILMTFLSLCSLWRLVISLFQEVTQ